MANSGICYDMHEIIQPTNFAAGYWINKSDFAKVIWCYYSTDILRLTSRGYTWDFETSNIPSQFADDALEGWGGN